MACGRRTSSSSTSTSTAADAAPSPSRRRRWAEWNGKYRDDIRRFIKFFSVFSFVNNWHSVGLHIHMNKCSIRSFCSPSVHHIGVGLLLTFRVLFPYHFPLPPPPLEVDDLPRDV